MQLRGGNQTPNRRGKHVNHLSRQHDMQILSYLHESIHIKVITVKLSVTGVASVPISFYYIFIKSNKIQPHSLTQSYCNDCHNSSFRYKL